MTRYKEIDLSSVKSYSTARRRSMMKTSMEGTPAAAGMTFREFLAALPGVSKANDLKTIAGAVAAARNKKKPIIAMLGGHVIKTGCGPVLRGLVSSGYITHVASNGSAAIHDMELARFGSTSEDVSKQLETGAFGMAEETAVFFNDAARQAAEKEIGFGEAVGALLASEVSDGPDRSLIAHCFRVGIPYTLHVAIGTDIVHQHPGASGAAIGDASLRDFRILTAAVADLANGGVVLNFGSAVIMPEVFLKALAVARNLDHGVKHFTTANFDMIQHYRPIMNVVERPVAAGGNGYAITGHHELMIPLLAAAIYESALEKIHDD